MTPDPAAVERTPRLPSPRGGPRTALGKARAALNPTVHGLRAAGLHALLPGEDGRAFRRLRRGLAVALAPAGEVEAALVDLVAADLWRLGRCGRLEGEPNRGRSSDSETFGNRIGDVPPIRKLSKFPNREGTSPIRIRAVDGGAAGGRYCSAHRKGGVPA